MHNGGITVTTSAMASEERSNKIDWQGWAHELITVADDSINSNWSDLLVDVNVPDPDSMVVISMPLMFNRSQYHSLLMHLR